MSNLEKSVDEQIIELVNQYKQITIKQIAERLQKDLGQISKRIKILEQKNVVKKIKYSPTGSKQHSVMVQLVSGQVQQNSFKKENIPEENLDIQLDNVNLTDNLTDNLISQLDNDKLNSIPDDNISDLDLDLSDINFSGKKSENTEKLDEQIQLLKNRIEQLESQSITSKNTSIPESIQRKLIKVLRSQKSRFEKSANPKSPGMYEMIHDIVEYFNLDLKKKLDGEK